MASPTFSLRQLQKADLHKGEKHYNACKAIPVAACPWTADAVLSAGYLELLAQLTVVGEISEQQFTGSTVVGWVISSKESPYTVDKSAAVTCRAV